MPDHVRDEEVAAEPAVEERRFVSTQAAAHAHEVPAKALAEPIFDVRDVAVFYGEHRAVTDITLGLAKNEITALIGPSGCGKSTFIRCLNRMNDLIPSARVEGQVIYHDQDLYDAKIDPVQVRKRIGMVFQKPNPFPKSIYDNIAFGPRVMGMKGEHGRDRRERAEARGAVGRRQGPPEDERVRHVGRPAAAPVHRPRARHVSPTCC